MSHGPTIVLKSYWDVINIGDMGHAPGTLRVFQRYLPDARIVLWPDELHPSLTSSLSERFPDVRIVEGQLDEALEPTTPALRDALEGADLVVQNSSMGVDTGMMRVARKFGKPFGLFAQSYFPWIADNPNVLESLREAAFIGCRDTPTVETLRHAGIRPPRLGFNPDGCFGFDWRDDAKAEAYLAAVGLEPQRFITIQLRTNTQKHPGTDSWLNPAHPTPEHVADDERRAAIFRGLITRWVEHTGHKVLIAPEVRKEIQHNQRLIVDPLPARIRRHVVVRDQHWFTEEATGVFARAHTVVCHEPHSCIFALAQGTPILHTYSPHHGPKYHMFSDIGVGQWLLPLDEWSAEDLFNRLLDIDRDYARARACVAEAMGFVHRRFERTCRWIAEAAGHAVARRAPEEDSPAGVAVGR